MGKSIIEQVEEQRTQELRTGEVRAKYAQRIAYWRQQGYRTTRLDAAIGGRDFAVIDQAFASYETDVRKMWDLGNRLRALDVRGYEREYYEVMGLLLDPDQVADCDKKLTGLEAAIKDRAAAWKKKQEDEEKAQQQAIESYNAQQVIGAWRARGYRTDRLDKALAAGGPAKLKEVFPGWETDVRKLWDAGNRLQRIDFRGYEVDYANVHGKLMDPDAVAGVEKGITDLEQKIGGARGQDKVAWTPQAWEEYQKSAGAAQTAQLQAQQVQVQAQAPAAPSTAPRQAGQPAAAQPSPQEWQASINAAVAKAKVLLDKLRRHQDANRPEYSPLGYYLGDRDNNVSLSLEALTLQSKSSVGFLRDHLFLTTRWVDVSTVQTAQQMAHFLGGSSAVYKKNGQFGAECFLVFRPRPEVVQAVEQFRHPSYTPFLYDLETDKLSFNHQGTATEAFAAWFLVDAQPPTLRDIIRGIEDKNGIFYLKDVQEKLRLSGKELDRYLDAMQKAGKLTIVSKQDGSWAFVE